MVWGGHLLDCREAGAGFQRFFESVSFRGNGEGRRHRVQKYVKMMYNHYHNKTVSEDFSEILTPTPCQKLIYICFVFAMRKEGRDMA